MPLFLRDPSLIWSQGEITVDNIYLLIIWRLTVAPHKLLQTEYIRHSYSCQCFPMYPFLPLCAYPSLLVSFIPTTFSLNWPTGPIQFLSCNVCMCVCVCVYMCHFEFCPFCLFLSVLVSVLLSTSVEILSVSRIRDISSHNWTFHVQLNKIIIMPQWPNESFLEK